MSAIILRYIKLNLTLNHKQGDKTYYFNADNFLQLT